MIKSFLKRVFSSSNEVSTTVETPTSEEITIKEDLDRSPLHPYKTLDIKLNWLESQSWKEIDDVVRSCYEQTREGTETSIRIRLRLEDQLQSAMDESVAIRLRNYLDLCEQEIADLTFFLDKSDEDTMELYKKYLLPESIEQLNLFLRDRCMMIYSTAEGLGRDYQKEIEDFFGALQLPITSTFFEDFEQFKEQLLSSETEIMDPDPNEDFAENYDEESVVTPTMIEVSREEVENENIHQFDKFMEYALYSPEQAKRYEGSLLFSFYGFSRHEDLVRMMNRKEIKEWASILVEKHPYIFYFLNDVQYPMTKFLTSLVVTTEVEDGAVYYNEDELTDFRNYIEDALTKLANWLGISETDVLEKFDRNFLE